MAFLDSRAIRDWCRKEFVSNDDVLKTKEAVTANAEEGKIADALVIKEVFQSVSDGKGLVASAITDKGILTDATAAFEVMADNIRQIESGGSGGGNCPVSSPYHFAFSSYQIPFSTGAGNFTCPFAFNKLKRITVTKAYMYVAKSSTSNASGGIWIELRGVKEGATAATNMKSWGGSLSASETSKILANVTAETEIDLSGYESIEGIRILKYSVSGTVVEVKTTINFEADLYF